MLFEIGKAYFDTEMNRVFDGSNEVLFELSFAEKNILLAFIEHQAKVIPKSDLENKGWEGKPVSESSLSVAMTSLRKKLANINGIAIKTIPRKGYMLTVEQGLVVQRLEVIPDANHSSSSTANKEKTDSGNKPKETTNHPIFASRAMTAKLIKVAYVIVLSTSFVLFLVMYIFRVSINCIEHSNNRTLCFSEQQPAPPLKLADDIGYGSTAFYSKKNLIVMDKFNKLSVNYHDNETN